MGVRVYKLLSELNIGFAMLDYILYALGHKEPNLSIDTMLPDDVAFIVRNLCNNDDFFKIIESDAGNGVYGHSNDLNSSLKIVGFIDLDELNGSTRSLQSSKKFPKETLPAQPLVYSKKQSFWIDEIVLLSPKNKRNDISVGNFDEAAGKPFYSVLIGINGSGKSMLMKEIVEFFIDLHAYVKESEQRVSGSKTRLRGVRYHIDGVECKVVKLKKNFLTKIDGHIHPVKDLRLPSIVACHFGAFDKLPIQKVNGSQQTKYDVACYKYVGAHVNGSMISSSAIAFRLLFVLNENMDDRLRRNICSILDFIGYDPKISLLCTFVQKAKKDGAVRDDLAQRVNKDKEYSSLDKQERIGIANRLYTFYKTRTSSGKAQYNYDINFDGDTASVCTKDELQTIYKLKQYDFVSAINVIFYRKGNVITSDEMSSGEFAMLSTVLSISAAASSPHTLVLVDEPELSLHPNWQMTLIDNLDRALNNQVCHLLIATHSHMLVSDLPMNRSYVSQVEKDCEGNLNATTISESTYGWSAEEVLLKVFKTATDRNRYFGERIGKLLEQMANNTIVQKEVERELKDLQEISMHLSDIDPMKTILNTIVEAYSKKA